MIKIDIPPITKVLFSATIKALNDFIRGLIPLKARALTAIWYAINAGIKARTFSKIGLKNSIVLLSIETSGRNERDKAIAICDNSSIKVLNCAV